VFSTPVSSKKLLRLEVKVEGPEPGVAALTAPLSGEPCVLHSSAVSQQLHDGMPPIPLAFSASSTEFIVTLADNKDVRISVNGADVSLFDMKHGQCLEKKLFDEAPDHWQDFITSHRSAPPAGQEWAATSALRASNAMLQFQECALIVGTTVTVAGELHRSADGKLSLRPWHAEAPREAFWRAPVSKAREPWRTSWEQGDCRTSKFLGDRGEETPGILRQKVLASDDDALLLNEAQDVDGKLRECTSSLGMGQLLGR